jgi:hypothetical protein
MINITTVHWRSPKWIGVQLDYLERSFDVPYRVFGALNGISDKGLWKRFDFAEDLDGGHPEKLNELADIVAQDSDPSDVIIFLDGDAFPVQPMASWLKDELERYPLVAVQRREILDDRRPHPCFCATTVGFWREIQGDWRRGPWIAPDGREHNDVGSTLAIRLEERGVPWLPMNRTNTNNIHPVWFAIYGHRIYHHGAGFRTPFSRVDINRVFSGRWKRLDQPSLGMLATQLYRQPQKALQVRPRHLKTLESAIDRTMIQSRKKLSVKKSERLSDRLFNEILNDPKFFRKLDSGVQ